MKFNVFSFKKVISFPSYSSSFTVFPHFSSSQVRGRIPSKSYHCKHWNSKVKSYWPFKAERMAMKNLWAHTVSPQGTEPSLAFTTKVADKNKWLPATHYWKTSSEKYKQLLLTPWKAMEKQAVVTARGNRELREQEEEFSTLQNQSFWHGWLLPTKSCAQLEIVPPLLH